ncbi:MAG: hypothetical protein IPM21_05805 [Acidobacteria bacterium]|nr:hypothetical protein [Acidobacteriota bacterium]
MFFVSTSFALGADRVSGTLTIKGRAIPVRHVYALLHDNAEGLLHYPTELRILITDRKVPLDSLYGINFLPVGDLAKWGEVEGILLRFDPKNLSEVDLTVLMPSSLQKVTDRVTIKNFEFAADRVKGSFEFNDDSFQNFPEYPNANFIFEIDAFVNPIPAVTADMKGNDVLNSPQIKALSTIAGALVKADIAEFEKHSSERAIRNLRKHVAALGANASKSIKSTGTELKKVIPGVKRVVVRGNLAVVILPENSHFELIFVDGSWKTLF